MSDFVIVSSGSTDPPDCEHNDVADVTQLSVHGVDDVSDRPNHDVPAPTATGTETVTEMVTETSAVAPPSSLQHSPPSTTVGCAEVATIDAQQHIDCKLHSLARAATAADMVANSEVDVSTTNDRIQVASSASTSATTTQQDESKPDNDGCHGAGDHCESCCWHAAYALFSFVNACVACLRCIFDTVGATDRKTGNEADSARGHEDGSQT